jgi:hypothetical protein
MTPQPLKPISINRSPVLTLWAAIVAQQFGFNEDEALTVGKAFAGLTAKGRRVAIATPQENWLSKARERPHGEVFRIDALGRPVLAMNTEDGIRAVHGLQVIEPDGVRQYLHANFGDNLGAARSVMEKLAKSLPAMQLAERALQLYERFRPEPATGIRWRPARGELDLEIIERLVKQ